MTVKKLGKGYQVDITYNKKRWRIMSPDRTKKGAKVYEAFIRSNLAKGIKPEQSEHQRKQAQLYSDFVPFWFKMYAVPNNKPSERARKKHILNSKLLPFFGRMALNEISPLQIVQFKALMSREGHSNGYINGILRVLGKSLNSAEEWFGLENMPKIEILKIPPLDNGFFAKEQCTRLLEEMNGLWHDIVFTASKTGLRIGELKGLRWRDIRFDTKAFLTVNHTWCNIAKGLVTPKGNEERVIPLTRETYGLLNKRKREGEFVFGREDGKPFNQHELNCEIKKACKRAELPEKTCHYLRHSFASQLALAGVPLIVIMKLLGHKNIQITMRYAHLAKSSLREAVDVLEEVQTRPTTRRDDPEVLFGEQCLPVPKQEPIELSGQQ